MSSTINNLPLSALEDSTSIERRHAIGSTFEVAADRQVSSLRPGFAAGVVLFRPEPQTCKRLVGTLCSSAGMVYVVLNSPICPELRDEFKQDARVCLLGSERNLGIGAALNMIASAALFEGYERLFLFDQDSRPSTTLTETVYQAALALEVEQEAPAIVAPRLVAPQDGPESKAPTYRAWHAKKPVLGHRPVAFVPTSGSLLNLTRLKDIGVFRADYFIDGVDLEWCFRAWSRGYGCWLANEATMEHPIGKGLIRWPLPKFAMPKQEPFRMHCHIRNAVYGLRLSHVPLNWKVKQLAYLPLQILAYAVHHKFKTAVLVQLISGVVDGLRGRLGPPESAPGRKSGACPLFRRPSRSPTFFAERIGNLHQRDITSRAGFVRGSAGAYQTLDSIERQTAANLT